MRLLALSDLHLASAVNRAALADLPAYPEDWLIVAGDVAEKLSVIEEALAFLASRFAKIVFVPGNHDLWATAQGDPPEPRGRDRYERLVEIARAVGAVTPEDPFPVWPGPLPDGLSAGIAELRLVPLFLLYDYSFRPAEVPLEGVIEWAEETHNVCSDELFLSPEPFETRIDWCRDRLSRTAARLTAELPAQAGTVLINHWPLRRDLIRIPRVPRFTPWCGTTATEDWHRRFRAHAVVTGHLHTRRTDIVDGTRFEEVSLGYPRQWDPARGMADYLRRII